MGEYVDGFVLPDPKANIGAYRKLAELSGKLWRGHGTLDYVECVAGDVQVGELTSFPRSVILKEDQTVVFGTSESFILSLLALVVLGAADMVSVVVRWSLVQLATPDAMRRRVADVAAEEKHA